MTELLTAAQMRAIEAAAIASGEVTGLELMERAGRGVVEAVFAEWPELAAGTFRAVVLCGPGNNGGDGFVVARLLKEWGWEVEVFLYGEPDRMPADARMNYERWLGMGEVGPLSRFSPRTCAADVILDAIFGTGLSRPVEDEVARILIEVSALNRASNKIVAIEVSSAVCADSGRNLAGGLQHSRADLTVTFHGAKIGHYLEKASQWAGRLRIVDVGIVSNSDEEHTRLVSANCLGLDRIAEGHGFLLQHEIEKWSFDHKYSHGHALILSGPPGHGGAARLAARGALRIGAGVVTVGCPLDAIPENAARLDAVMLRGVADGTGLAEVLADKRINALCMGPGMGISDETRALLAQGLQSGRALVLDADALTLIARDAALFAALHANCILTPHAGEFARLFPDIAAKLAAPATTGPAYSKVDATRDAAKRAGCIVLFKGPDTVISDPSGRCAINSAHYDRAAPWLATAGSGDVLAGFITGLLARGFGPFDAACTAAWLHVECALSFGPGLIAEDLPEELPKVFRVLGL